MSKAEELYKKVEKLNSELKRAEADVADIKHCLEKSKAEYRIESVCRILDHIRREYRAGRICDLDALLCYCQNKLHGNIDGNEPKLEHEVGVPFVKGGVE